MRTIFVIKLGAIGDFIVADSAFQWIKQKHQNEKIILITTPAFESFARKLDYFDEVIALPRFHYTDIAHWKIFLNHLKRLQPSYIYDLQMVKRTRIYAYFIRLMIVFGVLKPVKWVGHLKSGYAYLEKPYFQKHPLERFARLFSKISHDPLPPLDLRRLSEDLPKMPEKPYVLMVPCASNAMGGIKKWPLSEYRQVVQWLLSKGYHVVIIGGPDDNHCALYDASQQHKAPFVYDFTGKTSFENIIALAKDAFFAMGNDTGGMHIAAASQCPVFGLFSKKAPSAALGGARGVLYHHFSADDLKTLKSDGVIAELEGFIKKCETLKRS